MNAAMHVRVAWLGALVIAAAGVLWAGPYPKATPAAKPARIVSLNLCADQLLLALADRDQIAGLTRSATDPGLSAEARRAHGLPLLRNSTEQILAIDPDLVVGMPASSTLATGVLVGQHYRALDLQTANSLGEIVASIRQTAAAVGHRQRGEALVRRMEQDLRSLPKPGAGKVAAYYQRRGYMTGTGTLIDELMRRVGLVNLAGKLGKPALAQVSLEEIVAAQPDFLIVESATDDVRDQGTEMLHHPALRGIPRLTIPQAWTVCGTPAYVRAARSLTEQIIRYRTNAR